MCCTSSDELWGGNKWERNISYLALVEEREREIGCTLLLTIDIQFYRMDVTILSTLMRPILTVYLSMKYWETGDIYRGINKIFTISDSQTRTSSWWG